MNKKFEAYLDGGIRVNAMAGSYGCGGYVDWGSISWAFII